MDLLYFPTEIWVHISNQLFMPEIRELSLTCQCLRRICVKRLRKQQRIAHAYRWIDARDAKLAGRTFIFHDMLFHILRGELSPSYTFEFECDCDCIEDTDAEPPFREEDVKTMRREGAKLRPYIQRAVDAAFWIEDVEKKQHVDAICHGNEDATLSILVPLLTNLRALRPPINADMLGRALGRIARTSDSSPVQSPLLANLALVAFNDDNNYAIGMELFEIVPYAALPSVRRLIIPHSRSSGHDDFPGWPADLPFSRVSEVYFDQSSITKGDIRGFARGFKGPCVIRQWWVTTSRAYPEGKGKDKVKWDYFELEDGGETVEWRDKRGRRYTGIKEGSRSALMKLKYPEVHENPGAQAQPQYDKGMNAMLERRLWNWREVS